MAITENNFTLEEFNAAVEANPSLLDHVRTSLTAKEFVVHDKDTHTNYLQTKRTEHIAEVTKQHADKLEADTLELTGVPKKEGEKYYDYLKRAVKEKYGSFNQMSQELEQLKAGAKPNEMDKARIKQLEELLKTKDKEHETALAEVTKASELNTIKLAGEAAAKSIAGKFKKDIPQSLVDMAVETGVKSLLEKATLQKDGAITFAGEDGEPLLHKETYKPLGFTDMLLEIPSIKDILDPAQGAAGAGSKGKETAGAGDQGGGDGGGLKRMTSRPYNITTQMGLTKYMNEQGYVSGSKEMAEDFQKFGKDLPLR